MDWENACNSTTEKERCNPGNLRMERLQFRWWNLELSHCNIYCFIERKDVRQIKMKEDELSGVLVRSVEEPVR